MSLLSRNQKAFRQLLKQYQQCDATQQNLLMIIGAYGARINWTQVKQLVRALEVEAAFTESGLKGSITTNETKQVLKDLGLLVNVGNAFMPPLLLINHLEQRCIDMGLYEPLLAVITRLTDIYARAHWPTHYQDESVRSLRYSLNRGEFERASRGLSIDKDMQLLHSSELIGLSNICFYPFDQSRFNRLPPDLQFFAFATLFARLKMLNEDNREVIAVLQRQIDNHHTGDDLKNLLAEQYLLADNAEQAAGLISGKSHYALALRGWLAFENGEFESAVDCYKQAIKARMAATRTRKHYLLRLPGMFYLLSLLKLAVDKDPGYYKDFDTFCSHYDKIEYGVYLEIDSYRQLKDFAQSLRNPKSQFVPLNPKRLNLEGDNYSHRLSLLIDVWCSHWDHQPPAAEKFDILKDSFDYARKSNDLWYARQAAELLFHYGQDSHCREFVQRCTFTVADIPALLRKKALWQQALDQLIGLNRPSIAQSTERQSRLIWWLDTRLWPYEISAGLQKMGKRDWLKPELLPLSQLLEQRSTMNFLTLEDEKIIQQIRSRKQFGATHTELDGFDALHAAIGHPALFSFSSNLHPLTIELKAPELLIRESAGGFELTMPALVHIDKVKQTLGKQVDFVLAERNGQHYELIKLDGLHQEIADIVTRKGLRAPSEAKQKVIESIRAIAPYLNIQSDIRGIENEDTGLHKVAPDQTLYVNIHNIGPGFQIQLQVQPLGPQGPSLSPGSGNAMVVAMVDGKRTQANRRLDEEKAQVTALIDGVEAFEPMVENRVQLDELEQGLECLEQLHHWQEKGRLPHIRLQWQKGQPIRVTRTANRSQMTLTALKRQHWFSLQGELMVTKEEVLEVKRLLEMAEQSQSRFIPMAENTYLALTEELRRQLQQLAAATFEGRFHGLSIPLVEQATEGMQFSADPAFETDRTHIEQAYRITPTLPSTLQAELRDYQQAGFQWACRLAHWGAGACLADDMGLGKTLQALAVILHRASEGPTLVICPTSVGFNWLDETRRFAPTLNPLVLGDIDKPNREAQLRQSRPFDLVICSYGLLQNESLNLQKVKWQTIVADEAQALKNPKAKRTIAANRLSGGFKMITTGTPVENNLSELWSLFNFINPGLLDSHDRFNKRFIARIENFENRAYIRKAATRALKNRIAPFVLRRLKSEVLNELPPRTEVNIHVEQSFEEMAFYEALRQRAVEKMLENSQDEAPNAKRVRLLAEITRLRQACCHPSLVDEKSRLPGAKLRAFDELVDELRQNNHKALVFSQFVGHLDILRHHLNNKGISFQYLDGSTSTAKRKQAVSAFQSGEGELFLISLKAGGFGLNLTAADYVIHMDPWWNPAVEDQASDRAHRLGQTRPVTIYRLLCRNTIEDKILALHQRKRELAENLLEDGDIATRLSLEQMMALLAPA